ncbi:hypothetical protein DL767_011357 [Monosporascus sp. MG133]|nr:hypothetical protein DL767_011357 [Monosporascus sp. MG133]
MTPNKETQDFYAWIHKHFRDVERQGKKRDALSSRSHYYIWVDTQSREYNASRSRSASPRRACDPSPGGSWKRSIRDAEVYANPRDRHAAPVHAHRILDAAAGVCASKIGGSFVISHRRQLLQCPRRTSARYHSGIVKRKCSRDGERLEQMNAERIHQNQVGRILRRTQASNP